MATCHQFRAPISVQDLLHEVVFAHRHAAGGDEGVTGADRLVQAFPDDRLVVPGHPQVDDLAAGLGDQGESIARLESVIRPGDSCSPGGVSSSPVDMTATRGRRTTGTMAWPRLATTPRWAGVSTVPAGKTTAPASRSPPARRMWSPGLASRRTSTPSPSTAGLLHHHDPVGPVGDGRTGHDPDGLAGLDGHGGRPAGGQLVDHHQAHGRIGGGAGRIRRPHRVPVHAVLAKGGTVPRPRSAAAAVASPSASASGTSATGSRDTVSRIRARTSSRGITSRRLTAPERQTTEKARSGHTVTPVHLRVGLGNREVLCVE